MPAGRRTWWGCHQLCDSWARRLVEAAAIAPGDLVLDVGAGTGALTEHLVRAGARVIAIELHPRRADLLRQRFSGAAVKVVRADASDLHLPRRPFRVVANPPFAITTALLRRLLAPRSRLEAAHLVVPRPVAARWASGRGRDASRWAATFDAAVQSRMPSSAFRPPGPEAAVLALRRR